jgi:hypothetical protein
MYKIKFLKKSKGTATGEARNVYKTVSYDDNRLRIITERTKKEPLPMWRIMGFLSVADIQCIDEKHKQKEGKDKIVKAKPVSEVIDMFYPDEYLRGVDKEVKEKLKAQLVKKTEPKKEPKKEPEQEPKQESKQSTNQTK